MSEATCEYEGSWIGTGPWTDGSAMLWRAVVRDGLPCIECWCNGVRSFVTLNPSSMGESPDVFVYVGPHGDPGRDGSAVFVTPDGVKTSGG